MVTSLKGPGSQEIRPGSSPLLKEHSLRSNRCLLVLLTNYILPRRGPKNRMPKELWSKRFVIHPKRGPQSGGQLRGAIQGIADFGQSFSHKTCLYFLNFK